MDQPEIKITPVKGITYQWKEIWESRELLYFFAWRDIKVKYKQTYLGILWAILQPTLMMLLFSFVFSRTLKISVGTVPYPVYVFSGLLLWSLFSSGITNSSESMISNAHIIRKIYFPRLIIPLSTLVVALVDFCFGLLVFVVLLLVYRQPLHWSVIICFPLGIIMTFLSSFGIGTMLSALNIKYRDFRYLLPFTMQLFFFASQVVYSLHTVKPAWFKYLLYCHPFNGALEVFSYPLQQGRFDMTGVAISCAVMMIMVITGLFYFKKTENYIADIL